MHHPTDDQLWQYYIASYSMMEPTEGVKKEDIAPSYLGRNMAVQHANTDVSYVDTYESMDHFDDQSAFIAPNSYKMLLSHHFGFEKRNRRAGETEKE